MREIGSEFWDVPVCEHINNFFPESTQWFLSGRSALQAIIKELGGVRSISLPSWCCDSMIKPFVDAGMDVCFYPVYWQKELIQETDLNCDALFLMDYFGYTSVLPDLREYKGIVIRDVTHSFFSTYYSDADYYFGSLRKWCGVWTGGYGWTRDGHKLAEGKDSDKGYSPLRKQAMEQKTEYINGQREGKGYLNIFNEAEDVLDYVGIAPAIDRDVQLAQRLDVELIKCSRRRNAEVLRRAFPEWLIFPKLSRLDTPMFVPVLVPDGKRNELRRHLIKQDIYCPIHWPISEYHKLDGRTAFIYENELSLVCDQRYTEDDMFRMVEAIKDFIEV